MSEKKVQYEEIIKKLDGKAESLAHRLASAEARVKSLEGTLLEIRHNEHHLIAEEAWRIDEALETSTSELVLKAERFAVLSHGGQKRRDKVTPYIDHPKYVASLVKTDTEKAVAWLHDVVEDTNVTIDIISSEFNSEVAWAVNCLTKVKGEDYLSYLKRVKTSNISTKVKIADITHNRSCLNRAIWDDKLRYDKYTLALFLLKQ